MATVDQTDTTLIGETASQMMEIVAGRHPSSEVSTVVVIVALDGPDGSSTIEVRCSDPRKWIGEALCAKGQHVILNDGR